MGNYNIDVMLLLLCVCWVEVYSPPDPTREKIVQDRT